MTTRTTRETNPERFALCVEREYSFTEEVATTGTYKGLLSAARHLLEEREYTELYGFDAETARYLFKAFVTDDGAVRIDGFQGVREAYARNGL
jgi:hypothetical protein